MGVLLRGWDEKGMGITGIGIGNEKRADGRGPIPVKFCMLREMADVIHTRANFGVDKLRVGVYGGSNFGISH